tara:strand:- start:13054 stop:13965 length:912 start_codon:yes stop_codon:yes gene_type:complete
MKIVVFGASGFVGQNVVEYLSGLNLDVVATDIMPTTNSNFNNVKFIATDLLDEQHVDEMISGADVVVHLATSNLRTSLKNPKRNIKINVQGTMNILESSKKHNVKKVIYSSASSIYGVPEYLPVDENHPKKPATVYGIGKYTGEHLLRVYNELYGLNYFVLRFTNVYGPYQHPDTGGLIPVVLSKIIKNDEVTVFGDGSQTRDFVYVNDLVEAIGKIIEREDLSNEIVNAGSGTNSTILEAVKACGSALGIEPNIVFKPQEGGERKEFKASLIKFEELFGFTPETSLEDGLKKTSEWIKKIIN